MDKIENAPTVPNKVLGIEIVGISTKIHWIEEDVSDPHSIWGYLGGSD